MGHRHVRVGRRDVAVHEEATDVAAVRHAVALRQGVRAAAAWRRAPKVLLVSPLSGHFATLLRGTVQTLLPEQDVWVTDWHNARDVGLADGSFGFDAYIEYLIRWLEVLGPETHVIAVCQPCVAALVATAVMSEAGNDCTPAHAHPDGRAHRHPGRSHGRQRPRHQQAHLVVRAQRDHHGADALRRRAPARCTPGSCSSRRSSP